MTSVAVDTGAGANRLRVAWVAMAVAVVAAVPFLPALHANFVTWDDDRNFLRNPAYRGLDLSHLKWMWTTFHMGHYVPLSWMTLGLDYALWGMDARGYHLTNIILHSANAAALFLVARHLLRLVLDTGHSDRDITLGAAFAALAFAVHPLRVESVAWITERRDVLSGLFYTLTVRAYLRAVEGAPMTSRRYAPVFVLCFAALLSKATAMTLPAVLLVLNCYPLRRLAPPWSRGTVREVFREVVPLMLLAGAAMLMSTRALPPREQLSVVAKFAVSSYSVMFYLLKTVLPAGLGPIYPMPMVVPIASPPFLVSYAIVAGLALLVGLEWRRWPGTATAVIVFVLVSLPMLGVIQNGPQIAADRYTYHAAPAIALLAGGAMVLLLRRHRVLATGGGICILAALAPVTWVQTGYWHNSDTLWRRAVQVSDESAIAHDGLGTVYFLEDSVTKALEEYKRATRVNPYYAESWVNIGAALARLGRFDDAALQFQRALAIRPDFDGAENGWGLILAQQGKLVDAVGHFRLALEINPGNADAELNWGNALVAGHNVIAALAHYKRAAELAPESVEIEARWGAALAQIYRLDDAIPHFRRAVSLDPTDERARKLLARALSERATPATARQ